MFNSFLLKRIALLLGFFCLQTTSVNAQTAEEKAWFEGLSPEFRKELRFSLDRIIGEADKMREPTAADVAWISDWKGFFFSNFSPIADLAPLKRFAQLERLTLNNMPVTSLEPLRGLNLYRIGLDFTNITDLAPLENMTNLESVDLVGTNVTTLRPLMNCTHLEAIDCRGTLVPKADVEALQKKLPDCKIWYLPQPRPHLFTADEQQKNRKWWNALPEIWQQTLRNELVLLHDTPTDLAILKMFTLKSLTLKRIETLDGRLLDFDKLDPIMSMPDLTDLICDGTGIESLEPLRKLPKLAHLSCRETRISDLSPLMAAAELKYLDVLGSSVVSLNDLKNNKKMRHLNVAGTKITNLNGVPTDVLNFINLNGTAVSDFAPLATAKGLITVEASHTNITSLQPLRDAVYMESLNMRQSKISEIKILSNKPRLMRLVVSETNVADLAPIGSLKELQILRFNGTKVSSLQAITNSQSLVELEFSDTPVKDLKPIGYLKNLQKLVFVPNKVESLIPLFALENLQKLVICKQHYTKDEVRELKRALIQADISTIDCK